MSCPARVALAARLVGIFVLVINAYLPKDFWDKYPEADFFWDKTPRYFIIQNYICSATARGALAALLIFGIFMDVNFIVFVIGLPKSGTLDRATQIGNLSSGYPKSIYGYNRTRLTGGVVRATCALCDSDKHSPEAWSDLYGPK